MRRTPVVTFVSAVALAASLAACAGVPGSSSPVQGDDPGPSFYAAQPAYAPVPQSTYTYNRQPVAPSQSWGDWRNTALAGGVGVAGGMIANRALSGGTAATVGEGAAGSGTAEVLTAGRALSAARTGAVAVEATEAAEAAEAVEIIEIIEGLAPLL
jgi:hypothetical protein